MVDNIVPKSPCGPEEIDYWFNFTTKQPTNILKYLKYIAIIWVQLSSAQEVSMTQCLFSKLEFNPSFYGAAPCHSFILQSRQQWFGLDSPFRFSNATLSLNPRPELGIGFKLVNGSEGLGAYQSNTIITGASWSARLIDFWDYKTTFHMGLEIGATQKRLDWSKLVFSSEIHPYLGYLGNTTTISPQNSVSNMSVNQGVGFHLRLNKRSSGSGLRIGGAWHNNFYPFNQQDLSFFDESVLATRYVLHGSAITTSFFNVDQVFSFKFDAQSSLRTSQFTYSVGDGRNRYGDELLSMAFIGFRNEMFPSARFNTILFGFTQAFNDYLIGISYDTNVGRLSSNYTYGTFEITMRKNFCTRKIGPDECFYDNWLNEDKMYRKWEQ